MRQSRLLLPFSVTVVLAGCQPPPPPAPPPPPPPPLPPHFGPPPAARCDTSSFDLPDGGTAAVTLTLSNEGGYCAVAVTGTGGRPFDVPLLPTPPRHGTVKVIRYNGKNSVEYVPTIGYVGADAFTVRFIRAGKPGYAVLTATVTVAGAVSVSSGPAAKK